MFDRSDERIHKIYDKFLQLARVTIEPEADRFTGTERTKPMIATSVPESTN